MAKIIMLKGLPASGKSTWAKEKVKENGNFVRISKDDLRENFFGGYSPKKEKMVIRIRNALTKEFLKLGRNVIIDDTNLNPKHEEYFKNLAKELGVKFEVNDSFLKVDPEECVERDLLRHKSVGERVIYRMYYQYVNPIKVKNIDADKRRRAVLCDIDGTLAHNLSGRNIYDYSRVKEDTPDSLVCAILDALDFTFAEHYLDIIILSGREDKCRKETEEWLKRNAIPYKALYMRKAGDMRDDAVVKEELYKKYIEQEYCVLGVIDDRNKVIRNWEKLGVKVLKVGGLYDEF